MKCIKLPLKDVKILTRATRVTSVPLARLQVVGEGGVRRNGHPRQFHIPTFSYSHLIRRKYCWEYEQFSIGLGNKSYLQNSVWCTFFLFFKSMTMCQLCNALTFWIDTFTWTWSLIRVEVKWFCVHLKQKNGKRYVLLVAIFLINRSTLVKWKRQLWEAITSCFKT